MKPVIQSPRGMSDLLPQSAEAFWGLHDLLLRVSNAHNFQYLGTPLLENEKVFTQSLGVASDIVAKEMFTIKGRERGDQYVLRPEGTAGLVRAYLQNGMHAWPQPVKLFTVGPMYRRERPQAGRYREFWQWDFEMIGSAEPICDAQIIQIIEDLFRKLKLKDYIFKVNSLGCADDRKKYRLVLARYYRSHLRKVCENCKRRYKTNPLRLLDCKHADCQPIKAKAPQLLNHLCRDCETHFGKVLECLTELEIPYELDGTLVRGLDYYSRTVFEVFFLERDIAIGGGGRYDGLVKLLGGPETPAVGCAIGFERLQEILTMHQVKLSGFKKPQLFLAQTSEEAKKEALKLVSLLFKHNFFVAEALAKSSLSSQLEVANRFGVRYVLILGHRELGQKSVILKDMVSGEQETIPQAQLIEELKRRL